MNKKILIIDDSALMRRVLSDIIKASGKYDVVDTARNGVAGLAKILKDKNYYDLIITDVYMEKMSGIEFLENLQKQQVHTKVIVVSSQAVDGATETIKALELGVFDFVKKPQEYSDYMSERFGQKLLSRVDAALQEGKSIGKTSISRVKPVSKQIEVADSLDFAGVSKVVAIACSTGGPKSLQSVVSKLPGNLDAPVLIVQHMPKGFTASLAARLNELSAAEISEAIDGEVLKKGHVYLAPGGMHIEVEYINREHRIRYNDEPAVNALKPCADIMYRSLGNSMYGAVVCVVMTGMGSDGTKGIKHLATKKKMLVIAQDEESCVVYGMPKAIATAGLADVICPLDEIANAIVKNVGVS